MNKMQQAAKELRFETQAGTLHNLSVLTLILVRSLCYNDRDSLLRWREAVATLLRAPCYTDHKGTDASSEDAFYRTSVAHKS